MSEGIGNRIKELLGWKSQEDKLKEVRHTPDTQAQRVEDGMFGIVREHEATDGVYSGGERKENLGDDLERYDEEQELADAAKARAAAEAAAMEPIEAEEAPVAQVAIPTEEAQRTGTEG